MIRLLLTALSFTAMLAAASSGDPTGQNNLALVAAFAAVVSIAAVLSCTARGSLLLAQSSFANGPVAAERRLHGVLRRVSSPDAPGRPLPRAPGTGSRPA